MLTDSDTQYISRELEHAIGISSKPIGLLLDLTHMAGADWVTRWEEIGFLQKHSSQIARLAIEGTSDWEELASMILVATSALQAQTLYFKQSELQHAWH